MVEEGIFNLLLGMDLSLAITVYLYLHTKSNKLRTTGRVNMEVQTRCPDYVFATDPLL